ncbi:hypothetical protein FHS18_005783 [Paenibacillus phyllosphaerae]|uniref:Uncharacterized protein n=1 Tax=Paenibacillus phyllosphaerae TaxID=274593 RepID=A0A7W5B3C2_9BACL|nr:hypothetical protein [Paenibacillus phyllosphaerae]MBB3113670.1 hypothetical protein [Paenibacillus phyllosphaerae]
MSRFIDEQRQPYTDLSTVASQSSDLFDEDSGGVTFGSAVSAEKLGKSKPWRLDQQPFDRYDYEDRSLRAYMKYEDRIDDDSLMTPDAIDEP